MVVCDEADDHPYVKRKPCLIIEVLSESTETVDRGEKLNHYRLLGSLQAYLLVNQTEKRLELYRRLKDISLRYDVFEAGDSLRLPCGEVEIGVDEVYRAVDDR